jgi:hypothetical protein
MQQLDMRWQDDEDTWPPPPQPSHNNNNNNNNNIPIDHGRWYCVNQSGGGENDGPFLVLEFVVVTNDDVVVILGGCNPPTKLDGINDVSRCKSLSWSFRGTDFDEDDTLLQKDLFLRHD